MALVARAQLDFVGELMNRFSDRPSDMRPQHIVEAQYIALIAMMRSVGHVFEKVDCDTSAKKEWAKAEWEIWKQEEIFRDFIEPARNQLLKEFAGWLPSLSAGIQHVAVVSDPKSVSFASKVIDFDAREARAPNGKPLHNQLQEAATFWDRSLRRAELKWSSWD